MKKTGRLLLLCAFGLGVCGLPSSGEAKVLDLYAGVRGGGVSGWGGVPRGPGLGLEIGAEIIVLDAFVDYTQLFDGNGSAGTVTQFLVGVDGDFAIDGRLRPRTYLRLGGAFGAALITPKPIDFPLSNDEVSDKGFVGRGTFAIERHLNAALIMGVELVGGYHFLFPGGVPSETERPRYTHGGHLMGLLTFSAHFEPLR